jgi:hypothetical protein
MKTLKYSLLASLLIFIMFAPLTVESNQESTSLELPMLINGGVDGSWANPEVNSQGFAFETIPSLNLFIAYWYTFPVGGEGREWFLGIGDINGASTELTIYRVEGGVFDMVSLTEEVKVGSAILTFESCSNALFEYTLSEYGIEDQFALHRLTPDVDCESSLPQTQITFVSNSNSWINAKGAWVFDLCVQLGPSESHGREEFRFDDSSVSFDMDHYNTSDCTGPVEVLTRTFELSRIDKTQAMLGNDVVIANRVLLREISSGEETKLTFYIDDSQAIPLMTHGILDGALDADGFPAALHELFATKQ